MDKFKTNKPSKKSKFTYKGKCQVTNISSLPLTPQEIAKRDARVKKFSAKAPNEIHSWNKVVLRSRHHNNVPENAPTTDAFIFLHTREEQKKYHSYIKSLKKESINTKLPCNPNRWPEVIQNYRKLREAIVGENSKADKFVINVYQESVEACLKAKEFSDEKLLDDELAKSLLTLIEKLYPTYLNSADKLTSKRKKKMGLYYSYYLFYQLGINSCHLGQVLSACKTATQDFFLEHPDVKLATQLCMSIIHLQYIPFFLKLEACKPSQREMLKHLSQRLRVLSAKVVAQAYISLPTAHFLRSLGLSTIGESIDFLASLPDNTFPPNRVPRFSTDYHTVFFRPAR